MAKKDSNEKLPADPEIERLSSEITTARREAKRWKEYETERVEEPKAYIEGKTDVLFLTEAGDEVVSITATTPSITYDYKSYFAAHPEEEAVLKRDYAKEGKSQTRVNTSWVARN